MKWNSRLWLCFAIAWVLAACSDSNDSSFPPSDQPALLPSYELSSTTSIPSGFAYDPVERNFYLAGIADGSIVRVDAVGNESEFRAPDNLVEIWGAEVDPERRRLWICARDPVGIDHQVWIYDLNTDERETTFLLGALWPKGDCNDFAIDEDGNAFVTDPFNPNIYKLDPVTGEGSIYVSDPMFANPLGLPAGLNGIQIAEDGSRLVTSTVLPAAIYTITLPMPDSIVKVELEGDPLTFPDGMQFLDGSYYSIAIGTVHRIRFNSDYTSAIVSTQGGFDEVTSAAAADGHLYVVNSEAQSWLLGGEIDLPFEFFTIDLEAFD